MLFPETVFLKEGKFDLIFQLDKDYQLVTDNRTQMINLKIRMKLTDIVKDRKKETGFSGTANVQRLMLEKIAKATMLQKMKKETSQLSMFSKT